LKRNTALRACLPNTDSCAVGSWLCVWSQKQRGPSPISHCLSASFNAPGFVSFGSSAVRALLLLGHQQQCPEGCSAVDVDLDLAVMYQCPAGEKVIRYHPFKAVPINNMPMTACAMCTATGEQTCLNCLGEGYVSPGPLASRRGSRSSSSNNSSSSSSSQQHLLQQGSQ